MKFRTVLFMGASVAIFAFASCKKKSSASVSSNLQGTWRATYDAVDANGNGVLDANEKVTDTTTAKFKMTINSNNTLVIYYMDTAIDQQSWTLQNGDTYIKFLDTAAGSTPTYQHIDNISSSSMTLKDTTGGIVSWTIYAKQ